MTNYLNVAIGGVCVFTLLTTKVPAAFCTPDFSTVPRSAVPRFRLCDSFLSLSLSLTGGFPDDQRQTRRAQGISVLSREPRYSLIACLMTVGNFYEVPGRRYPSCFTGFLELLRPLRKSQAIIRNQTPVKVPQIIGTLIEMKLFSFEIGSFSSYLDTRRRVLPGPRTKPTH